jgi:hypothetical protein
MSSLSTLELVRNCIVLVSDGNALCKDNNLCNVADHIIQKTQVCAHTVPSSLI